MNVGLAEAATLAERMGKVLRKEAPLRSLENYNRERQDEWQKLLGLTGGLRSRGNTNAWVQTRTRRMLSCLPASGENLARMSTS